MIAKTKTVQTASPIRMWYLTRFRGLTVRAVKVTPFVTFLGEMAYSRCWVLVSSGNLPAPLG